MTTKNEGYWNFEKTSKRKTSKSLEAARKFFKDREDEIIEAVWKERSLEIFFNGGSFKIDRISPEEAALVLNHLYLASGSLYFQALRQMTVQKEVHFSKSRFFPY